MTGFPTGGRVFHIRAVARQVTHRLDRDHEVAHAARGLVVHGTFQGSYQLQAWGGSGDALIVRVGTATGTGQR